MALTKVGVGQFAFVIVILCILVWAIASFVKRRGRKMSVGIPISVGNSAAQRRFIDSHKPFLQEFPELQSLLAESFRRSEEKCYPESQNQQTSGTPEQSDEDLAREIVLSLQRFAFDDFGELLILAGNGMEIGAKKTLRSLYERLVVSQFESRDWETDLWLMVTPTMRRGDSVQPHLRATSAQAILKNVEGRFAAWQNLSTDSASPSMATSTT